MREKRIWEKEHFTNKDREEVLVYAQKLIQAKSYNPPGDESRAGKFAAEILEKSGFRVTVEEFEENRINVCGVYGNEEDIALILNGHLDVVPAFGQWERSPSGGERENGILYGRGSSDMLGGVAGILKAAEIIGRSQISSKRGIMVLLVADEEDMNRGIRHILSKKKLKAEYAVIAEPTECEIQLGNRGFSSFYIHTSGVACHASEPWNGINAIYKMGEIIRKVEQYADELRYVKNEFLGQATACIGTIQGGIRLNTVPDSCTIEIERRLLPGETKEEIKKELEGIVGDFGVVEDRSFFPASLIEKDSFLVQQCLKILKEIQGKEPVISVFKACTEASMFSVECGIPTLLLGPGSLKQAHRVNEFCKEQEIVDCAELFTQLLYEALEGKK